MSRMRTMGAAMLVAFTAWTSAAPRDLAAQADVRPAMTHTVPAGDWAQQQGPKPAAESPEGSRAAESTQAAPSTLSVSINGPAWVNTPGQYDWTASATGGSGPYTYQWWVEWNNSPYMDELGTGDTASLYVDENTATFFILYVEVTSGSQTASAQHGVCNFTASAIC